MLSSERAQGLTRSSHIDPMEVCSATRLLALNNNLEANLREALKYNTFGGRCQIEKARTLKPPYGWEIPPYGFTSKIRKILNSNRVARDFQSS